MTAETDRGGADAGAAREGAADAEGGATREETAETPSPGVAERLREEPTLTHRTGPDDREFDWRGWVLVGVVVVAFLVVPALVVARPVWLGDFRTTYLLLPLVPAFLLGATAVWAAVNSRRD